MIAGLTQKRINDEQKVDILNRQHRQEEEMWQRDGYTRLQVLRDQGEERYNATLAGFQNKLGFVRGHCVMLKGIELPCGVRFIELRVLTA